MISTVCSWLSIVGNPKAAILAQVGQFYPDEVGQYYSGANTLAEGNYAPARALLEESLSIRQDMDDKSGKARALLGLGLVELAEGKPEAREHILESLRLGTVELGVESSSLIGAAGLALQEGAPLLAAQILGAVQSALTPRVGRGTYDEFLPRANAGEGQSSHG